MMEFLNLDLVTFFEPYAYEPIKVYGFILVFMFASSFGLPIPEELTLISAGLVAYMAHNPEIYPPPYEGAIGVNIITLSIVCFLAVFLSDLTVYFIGKFFGARIIKTKFFQKQVAGNGFDRINSWFSKYGPMACGIFRFTPGLRFPGHMSCGLFGIPIWKFVLVDGMAALISVPTQVYFVATYGDVILEKFKAYKGYAFIAFTVVVFFWLAKKIYIKHTSRNA